MCSHEKMDHKNSMAYHQSIKFIQYKTGKRNGEKSRKEKNFDRMSKGKPYGKKMDKTLHDSFFLEMNISNIHKQTEKLFCLSKK